jgi:hypothetical protein
MARPRKNKPRGLGDTVETIIKATGLDKLVSDDCGCEARKEALNNLLPYRYKARCVTEEETAEWKAFKDRVSIRIPWEDVQFVCKLYSDVFSKVYWEPCSGCSPKPLISMINRLDVVFDEFSK